jgi:hypothetical protein
MTSGLDVSSVALWCHGWMSMVASLSSPSGPRAVLQDITPRVHVEWILQNLDSNIEIAKAFIKTSDGTGEDMRNNVEMAVSHVSHVTYAGTTSGSKKKARLADVGAMGGDDDSFSTKKSKNKGIVRYCAVL